MRGQGASGVEPVARDHSSRLTLSPERSTPWRSITRFARWLATSAHWMGQDGSIEAYRKSLIESGAVKIAMNANAAFQLRNGSKSNIYVDHSEILCQPETNVALVRALIQYLNHTFEANRVVLVNVDSKASPQLTGAIAAAGGFRQILVLPEAVYYAEKGIRRRLRFPNNISSRDVIVIIDDVLTPHDTTALRVAELVRSELTHVKGFTTQVGNPSFHIMVGLVQD